MLLNNKIKNLTNESSEELIAVCIDRIRRSRRHSGRLVDFLDYGHIIYNGRSKNETIRIRGYLLESFMHTGLPQRALPYVLDELESSKSAYIVAGAAIALRGLREPYPELTNYLFKAIRNIRYNDDSISFKTYRPQWPLDTYTTALEEIFKTFQWMGGYATHATEQLKSLQDDPYFSQPVKSEIKKALNHISETSTKPATDCCGTIPPGFTNYRHNIKINEQQLTKIRMEDQDQQAINYTVFFSGKPSLVLFFYTRCDNSNRCSLNITRMGQLQEALKREGLYGKIKIAAITYDPAYDLPMRIKPYCLSRGFIPGEYSKAFRIDEGMDILLAHLKPGVNYNGSILNHHTSELFLLDDKGMPNKRMPGIEWDIEKIITEIRSAPHKKKIRFSFKNLLSSAASVLLSFILIFFPKCPFCAAAYLSMLGISRYEFFRVKEWVFPSFIALLLINLFALFWMGRKRQWFLPFYLSLAGACCIIMSVLFPTTSLLIYSGMSLVITGSLLNGLPAAIQQRTRLFFSKLARGYYFPNNHFSDHKPFKL